MLSRNLGFDTRAIHGATDLDSAYGALAAPIYQTATYAQDGVGKDRGHTYSRVSNPTVAALEAALGALEDAPPAVCFRTGMAAIAALCFATLRAGERVLIGDVVYGGTVRFARELLSGLGVRSAFVDATDPLAVADALDDDTRLVIVESPANPTLRLCDVAAIAGVVRGSGATLAVDNTFLTPALLEPLALGADCSVYSTTKYLEGHNATVGGAIVSRDEALLERLRWVRKTLGNIQAPQEAWLTMRGVKTLALRMGRHSANALEVARWLESEPAVRHVIYPGLDSFPQRELALRQHTRGHGGIVAFELEGGGTAARAFVERLGLCHLAENLGATETLVTHPATMTHGDVPPDQRRAAGITDGLIRLSVGLEDAADIIADLRQALETQGGSR